MNCYCNIWEVKWRCWGEMENTIDSLQIFNQYCIFTSSSTGMLLHIQKFQYSLVTMVSNTLSEVQQGIVSYTKFKIPFLVYCMIIGLKNDSLHSLLRQMFCRDNFHGNWQAYMATRIRKMSNYTVTGKSLAHFFYNFLVAPPDGGDFCTWHRF